MKILVTGGDGFVGRHLCHYLSKNHTIHIIDNFRYGLERIRHYKGKDIAVHQCDIRDRHKLRELITKINPELVFHLAAIHYIPDCEKNPELTIATNVLGTVNIIKALKQNTRIIFASSAAVYTPDKAPHSENKSPTIPCDLYGYTKLHAEHYLEYLSAKNNLDARIVRIFNMLGPGETNPHLFPAIIAQLLKKRRKISLGNIRPRRDYIYVQDVAEGLSMIGLSNGNIKNGDKFNLGTSNHYSVKNIVDMMSNIIGEEIEIKIDPNRVRKADRENLCADISKIKNLLGWEPRFDIKSMLEKTWENPDLPLSLQKGILAL